MSSRRISQSFLLALLLAASAAPPVAGRGDLVSDRDGCILAIGPEIIYFAGYQPSGKPQRKFCEDAPHVGETIFVFDYATPELREMKAGFRILRANEEVADPSSPSRAISSVSSLWTAEPANIGPRAFPSRSASAASSSAPII
jgi:hypothetical protein